MGGNSIEHTASRWLPLLVLVLTMGSYTQHCAAQPDTGGVQLSESVELSRLVDLAAERLGLSLEYDTRLTGTASLRLRSELGDAELWALTNRLLASRGYRPG